MPDILKTSWWARRAHEMQLKGYTHIMKPVYITNARPTSGGGDVGHAGLVKKLNVIAISVTVS